MRFPLSAIASAIAALAVALCAGCAATAQSSGGARPLSAHPLSFKGRLAMGDPDQLPPAVAMSLAPNSRVGFMYREELSHEEHHPPTILSAVNPLIYLGYPMGEYTVTAFASLSIIDGDQVVGEYTAQSRITRSYTIYSQPTHRELDTEARAAVRKEIDEKLYADQSRVVAAIAGTE
jgi:hypothetical protein